ncbi:MAG TPA: HAMP domain-containing protein, partial [Geobacteraceae bacterium]|nr:HAMP domain-containing protein [Geobacteraceae bacterium]
KDTVYHETNLANTVVKATHYNMLKADQEGMHRIVANIGSQDGVEHVRIFNRKGVISYSSDRMELGRTVDRESAGCKGCHDGGQLPRATLGKMDQARRFVNKRGIPVIAITVPIYNETACSSAACHIHPEGQKVLGTLDIGLSAAPLVETLAVISSRMLIFCLMILVLTIGGVAAILRRSVFLPLNNLVEYTSRKRTADRRHPSLGCEIETLKYNFQLMEEQLQDSLATTVPETVDSVDEG